MNEAFVTAMSRIEKMAKLAHYHAVGKDNSLKSTLIYEINQENNQSSLGPKKGLNIGKTGTIVFYKMIHHHRKPTHKLRMGPSHSPLQIAFQSLEQGFAFFRLGNKKNFN